VSTSYSHELTLLGVEELNDYTLRKYLKVYEDEGHVPMTYKGAKRELFKEVFIEHTADGSEFLTDVYCHYVKSSNRELSTAKKHVINVEHSWPQSKFSKKYKKEIQKADLFHLFPTDKTVNNERANHPFGEVQPGWDTFDNCEQSQIGLVNSKDYPVRGTQLFFEPPKEIRGDIARGLFYFAVMYDLKISYVQEFFLKKWNHDDPVSLWEMMRSSKITELQGNRNPFIERPELADKISDF
jgi:endonuclease I